MTKKDYIKLADMLYMRRKGVEHATAGELRFYHEAIQDVEDDLVDILKRDNSRFDESKFRIAANPSTK